jgi:penicillin-binding protein 1A
MTLGVYNIDMTAAYAAIANKGTYIAPVYYTEVYDYKGNLILDNTVHETHSVLKETTAWLLTSALQSVVTQGTGGSAAISSQPVAGKTGTTQYDSDKWFCGFTPYYTAAIWIGYDDDNSKALPTSINHSKIWSAIMSQIHEGLPTGTFEQPDGIVEVEVCSQSGKLPVEGLCDSDPRGSQVITEYFSVDNQPTESCDTHVKVTVCNDSGDIASIGCTSTSTRIYIKKSSTNLASDSGDSSYSTADSEYAITDEKLTKLCALHSGTMPTAGATTSASGSTSTQATQSSSPSSSSSTTTTGTPSTTASHGTVNGNAESSSVHVNSDNTQQSSSQ